MDELLKAFLEASGGTQNTTASQTTYALADLIAGVSAVQQSTITLQNAAAETKAQTKSQSQSQAQSQESVGGKILSTVLDNGLGLVPLIGGLVGLFGGGSDTPDPLVKYALPPSVSFDAAEGPGGMSTTAYDQSGFARANPAPPSAASAAPSAAGTASSAQITVNVNAMDARSFMDRSGDIALAVRDAMLNLNSINDVVNDL